MNEPQAIADEKYEFKSATRSRLLMLFAAGLILFVIGVFMAKSGGGHEEGGMEVGKKEHAAASISKDLVASIATVQKEWEMEKWRINMLALPI